MRGVWSYIRLNFGHLIYILCLPFHRLTALFGIVLLVVFLAQLISGTMICFSLNFDPMLIPIIRNEEDIEDLYTDLFFWLHERGVDFLYILIYLHLYKKFYFNCYSLTQEGAWKTGIGLFLILHLVTFFGLVLCCTHLSEVTLTIASNIFHSLVGKYGKIYWWVFPNQELNSDTIVRLMYLHYITAFILFVFGLYHSLEMHYNWKDNLICESLPYKLFWWTDALKNEILTIVLFFFFFFFSLCNLIDTEALSLELFMWGDVGSSTDIRFYGVTPHWYFRAYMSWLIVCPHHYLGLLGLIGYFILLYYQPQIKLFKLSKNFFYSYKKNINYTFFYQIALLVFFMSLSYATSYLPYGKFYNFLGGNICTLWSFFIIFIFLSWPKVFVNYK